jgi:hypothetical protein
LEDRSIHQRSQHRHPYACDGLCGGAVEGATEHGQPGECRLLVVVEQPPRVGERRPQAAVTLRNSVATGLERARIGFQRARDLRRGVVVHPASGELDTERQAAEQAAQMAGVADRIIEHDSARRPRRGQFQQQLHAGIRTRIRGAVGWNRETIEAEQVLAEDIEGVAGGHQYAESRRGFEQCANDVGRGW